MVCNSSGLFANTFGVSVQCPTPGNPDFGFIVRGPVCQTWHNAPLQHTQPDLLMEEMIFAFSFILPLLSSPFFVAMCVFQFWGSPFVLKSFSFCSKRFTSNPNGSFCVLPPPDTQTHSKSMLVFPACLCHYISTEENENPSTFEWKRSARNKFAALSWKRRINRKFLRNFSYYLSIVEDFLRTGNHFGH